jgi:hypothetical protein
VPEYDALYFALAQCDLFAAPSSEPTLDPKAMIRRVEEVSGSRLSSRVAHTAGLIVASAEIALQARHRAGIASAYGDSEAGSMSERLLLLATALSEASSTSVH